MSSKTAKTYTQQSNRERPRKAAAEKKVVYKPVLDNPFRIRWPSVPINLQNAVLAYLLTLLEGVSEYHHKQCRASRKRKREIKVASTRKRRKDDAGGDLPVADVIMGEALAPADSMDVEAELPTPKPEILSHMVLGLNAVTKRLEQQARQVRRTVILPASSEDAEKLPHIAYVFCCRAEVNPAVLIDHLPPLVASCNSAPGKQYVKLIALPKDSERKLADALGIKNASILAIDALYPGLSELAARLEAIPLLTASWLTPSVTPAQLVPTHIKHICTSAPKDMKGTKEQRQKEKLAAKQKRKDEKGKASFA